MHSNRVYITLCFSNVMTRGASLVLPRPCSTIHQILKKRLEPLVKSLCMHNGNCTTLVYLNRSRAIQDGETLVLTVLP